MFAQYFFRPVGIILAFVYPFYASFKALDSKSNDQTTTWLTYWSVLALVSTLEYFISWVFKWFSIYYFLKAIFVLWLQLPQTKGATVIYWRLIHPQIKKHEDQIDEAVQQGGKRVQHMTEQLQSYSTQSTVTNRGGSSSAAEKGLDVSVDLESLISSADDAARKTRTPTPKSKATTPKAN